MDEYGPNEGLVKYFCEQAARIEALGSVNADACVTHAWEAQAASADISHDSGMARLARIRPPLSRLRAEGLTISAIARLTLLSVEEIVQVLHGLSSRKDRIVPFLAADEYLWEHDLDGTQTRVEQERALGVPRHTFEVLCAVHRRTPAPTRGYTTRFPAKWPQTLVDEAVELREQGYTLGHCHVILCERHPEFPDLKESSVVALLRRAGYYGGTPK
jgi:hypothetical protein